MKSYPSILRYDGLAENKFYTFLKIDGSNLRFEYSNKRGWYKFGTRTRLFDETDEVFGSAIGLFHDQLVNDLEKVIKRQNIKNLVVFAEFWGEQSFAGNHVEEDTKTLTLFDASIDKKGIISPQDFLKLFGDCQIPYFFGLKTWNEEFIKQVKESRLRGKIEGVVGKTVKRNQLFMVKLKSNYWIDKVKSLYDTKTAETIIRS